MLLPTMINYVFNELASQNFDMATCFTNATLEKIKAFEELEKRQEVRAKKELKSII